MGKSAILAIRIIGDATDAVTALDKVDGSAKSMESTMNKAAAGSALALAGITAAALSCADAASQAEQAAGAVDSVYGAFGQKIHETAQTAAADVGLSARAYSEMSAILGAQLKNMGVPMENLVGQSSELIGLGADLAATFGGTTADAVSALSSLLRGERDPIERYGVSIKAADVEAQKAAMGLSGLTGEADAAATTQATLALLMRQTADASGQFARESDTAAGTAQIAAAEWENASAALGEQLLPLMADGATMLADLAGWMGENSELVTVFAVGIGVLASGIILANGALKAYAAIQAIQTAAQWANNAAWLASPVTWIVLAVIVAIGLLIAIIVLVVQNWDMLAKVAADVWAGIITWIEEAARWLGEGIGTAVQEVGNFFADLGNGIANAFQVAVGWIVDAYNWLQRLVNNATPGWVKDMLGLNKAEARMTVAAPAPSPATARASRMLFSAQETAAGFAQPSAVKMTTTATAPSYLPGPPSAPSGDGPSITINFNGLVTDPEGTAREIRKILSDDALRQGRRRPEEANAW